MGWRGRIAAAFAATAMACGGAPAPRAPDLGTLSIPTPPSAPQKPAAPVTLARPDGVIAWVHVDDPDSILDLLGVTSQSLSTNPMLHELVTYFEAIDFHQPIDVVVVGTGKDGNDIEVAAKFGLRDPKTFFRAMSKHVDVAEQGDRIHLAKRSYRAQPDDDDGATEPEDFAICDLAGTGAERATCGTPKAMEAVGDWLRSGPEPRAEESTRTAKGPSVARALLLGDALRKVVNERRPSQKSGERSPEQLLEDLDFVSLDLSREDTLLALSAGVRLRAATSALTKELLAAPNTAPPGDAFSRLRHDASAVAYTPGGGSLPAWVTEWADSTNKPYDEKHTGSEASAAAKAIGKALEKPVTVAYGVRIDRAKTALAAVRAAKEPEKASAALQRALDEILVYAIVAPPAEAEKMLKDLATTWTNQAEARDKKYGSSYPSTKYAVRAAPAKLGLPKGSFFFETTSPDWRSYQSTARNYTKTKTEYVLHFPNAGGTWGLTCPDERSCVEGAKRLLAAAPATKRDFDAMFARKGIVAAGYLSSLVGAFTMHRYSMSSAANGAIPSDVLADIERDIAAPRLEMPFVVTTERQGEGGTVALEVRGERQGFKMLGEHAGLGGGSGLSLLVYLAMMLGH